MEPIARRNVIIIDRNSTQEQRTALEIMTPYPIDDGANYVSYKSTFYFQSVRSQLTITTNRNLIIS